jgi:hypothetical protein
MRVQYSPADFASSDVRMCPEPCPLSGVWTKFIFRSLFLSPFSAKNNKKEVVTQLRPLNTANSSCSATPLLQTLEFLYFMCFIVC